ncbi:DnaB helicase C-terminal domain-containing protein [Deltaproteobacteria bacterium]|nr:DnaB helicase C-terminal domain-containing protein [Deltaproteobacteria bacterium]
MKVLLRSTFLIDPMDSEDQFLQNYQNLQASGLGFDNAGDNAVWTYIQDFVTAYRHIPDYTTISAHFGHLGALEVSDRLEHLRVLPSKSRGDFVRRLEERADERRVRLVADMLKEAGHIVSQGIEIDDGKGNKTLLRGPIDAIRFIMDKGHDVVTPTTGQRLSGNVTQDGEDFIKEYDRVKNDPLAGIGQFTGIAQIDNAIRGAKRHELWTHAAFTGGLKSTFMLNWAYNQAVWYGHDSLIFSLEMPYHQCRRLVYALHSSHEKFANVHPPLDYQKVRDGELTSTEEWFLKEHVVPDFIDPKNGYGNIFIEVTDPDKIDFKVSDIRARAELIYSRSPFSLVFIDHALLVSPRKWVPSTTERLNEVIRDFKKMSMSFNRGAGMAVVLLFQISREGYKAAQKAREKQTEASMYPYNLTHLSYANEAERSSDNVTATWLDPDLAKQGQFIFQHLKSRDQEPFLPFKAQIRWPNRRIGTLLEVPGDQAEKVGDDIDNAIEGM